MGCSLPTAMGNGHLWVESFFWANGNVLELNGYDGCTNCEYGKPMLC